MAAVLTLPTCCVLGSSTTTPSVVAQWSLPACCVLGSSTTTPSVVAQWSLPTCCVLGSSTTTPSVVAQWNLPTCCVLGSSTMTPSVVAQWNLPTCCVLGSGTTTPCRATVDLAYLLCVGIQYYDPLCRGTVGPARVIVHRQMSGGTQLGGVPHTQAVDEAQITHDVSTVTSLKHREAKIEALARKLK